MLRLANPSIPTIIQRCLPFPNQTERLLNLSKQSMPIGSRFLLNSFSSSISATTTWLSPSDFQDGSLKFDNIKNQALLQLCNTTGRSSTKNIRQSNMSDISHLKKELDDEQQQYSRAIAKIIIEPIGLYFYYNGKHRPGDWLPGTLPTQVLFLESEEDTNQHYWLHNIIENRTKKNGSYKYASSLLPKTDAMGFLDKLSLVEEYTQTYGEWDQEQKGVLSSIREQDTCYEFGRKVTLGDQVWGSTGDRAFFFIEMLKEL